MLYKYRMNIQFTSCVQEDGNEGLTNGADAPHLKYLDTNLP